MAKYLKSAVLSILLSGLSLMTVSAMAVETAKEGQELSAEEQNRKALEAFVKIRQLAESSDDRASILAPLEAAYKDLIEKYPKAYLSQESYWRIMMIYINESDPPLFEKAEKLYYEFVKKYPDSHIKTLLSDTLSDGYYRHGKWDRILVFFAPVVKEFIQTEKLERPAELFLYSEAKFHTEDLVEAEKGYNIVVFKFPDSRESKKAKKRLEEIQAKKSK